MTIRFILNGTARETSAAPTMTVLDWLRTVAGLTGTKEGCAEGDCGACTILLGRERDGRLDWQAANSCLLLLGQIDGAAVLTVEGLARAGALHPVQEALLASHATQCGFCTPGFAMAMTTLQQREGRDDATVHETLAGNLCRCTGYRAIVDACRALPRARPETAEPPPPASEHHVDGASFFAPTTRAELLALRVRHPDAVLLAGGTDLGLRVSKAREHWPVTISTAQVAELKFVRERPEEIVIGAAATYADLLPSLDRSLPSFAALVRRIGSPQIRNLGTLAGNIATASPIGDTLPCLVALGAIVELASPAGTRRLSVEEFVTGYRATALRRDEIIDRVTIPLGGPEMRFAAYKLSKRYDQDISTVVAAFVSFGREARAAFGGMAPRVARAPVLEGALAVGVANRMSVAELQALLAKDFAPISDHRGSAAYRLRAAAGLARRFILSGEARDAPVALTVDAL